MHAFCAGSDYHNTSAGRSKQADGCYCLREVGDAKAFRVGAPLLNTMEAPLRVRCLIDRRRSSSQERIAKSHEKPAARAAGDGPTSDRIIREGVSQTTGPRAVL
jgi:hypothetical protein